MEGWIKLHRNITEHWLWKDEPYDKARAWIDLIMLANYEDKKMAYKGEIITCKRGDVNLSLSFLANRWKWDRRTVKHFLSLLEKDGMCVVRCTTHRTTITIVNYGFYQDVGTTECTTECTTKPQQDVQQSPTTKNIKNDKNVKNITKDNMSVSIQPIIDYLNEKAGRNYRNTSKNATLIKARLKEGFTEEDFKTVIDKKVDEWLLDDKMQQYLRPETLFGTKFESYLNQKGVKYGAGSSANNGRTEKDVSQHRSLIDCNFD